MTTPGGEADPFAAIVSQLEAEGVGGPEFIVDSRPRIQLFPGDEPLTSAAEFYDLVELNIAKGMLSKDEFDLVMDFGGRAIFSGDFAGYLSEHMEYEEGSQGLIAVVNFPSEGSNG